MKEKKRVRTGLKVSPPWADGVARTREGPLTFLRLHECCGISALANQSQIARGWSSGVAFPPNCLISACHAHTHAHARTRTYLVLVQSLIPGPDQGGVVPNVVMCHLISRPFHSRGCPARSLATLWVDGRTGGLLLGCRLKFRRRLSFFQATAAAVSLKQQPPSTRATTGQPHTLHSSIFESVSQSVSDLVSSSPACEFDSELQCAPSVSKLSAHFALDALAAPQ